ncbi:fumarylacetoacetate hydrolase family protein [Burkholderia gladioli]|nr:fumarylacetoacetate hydrolase family protein [Burkholderia gladioli]
MPRIQAERLRGSFVVEASKPSLAFAKQQRQEVASLSLISLCGSNQPGSAGIELQPGEVSATGTPAGVGIGLDSPKFLKSGDLTRIEIEGVGVLESRIGN